jgi:hypothetical protein
MNQNSLLLVVDAWDLCLDAAGNIAMAAPPYARAQSVANALRLFASELWYNTAAGVPYFEEILGHAPPASVFEQYMVKAAMTVPGVVSAQCTIQGINGRVLTGQVTFTGDDGVEDSVSLASLQ